MTARYVRSRVFQHLKLEEVVLRIVNKILRDTNQISSVRILVYEYNVGDSNDTGDFHQPR